MPRRKVIFNPATRADKKQIARRLRKEMTPQEQALWQRLRRDTLAGFHFRRQQVIDGYVVDFYCHKAWLIVELDGNIHDQQKDYDAERDQVLARRGLLVYRIHNTTIDTDIESVLKKIEELCQNRIKQ